MNQSAVNRASVICRVAQKKKSDQVGISLLTPAHTVPTSYLALQQLFFASMPKSAPLGFQETASTKHLLGDSVPLSSRQDYLQNIAKRKSMKCLLIHRKVLAAREADKKNGGRCVSCSLKKTLSVLVGFKSF